MDETDDPPAWITKAIRAGVKDATKDVSAFRILAIWATGILACAFVFLLVLYLELRVSAKCDEISAQVRELRHIANSMRIVNQQMQNVTVEHVEGSLETETQRIRRERMERQANE